MVKNYLLGTHYVPDTGLVPGYSRDRRLGKVPALWSCVLREKLTANVETNASMRTPTVTHARRKQSELTGEVLAERGG